MGDFSVRPFSRCASTCPRTLKRSSLQTKTYVQFTNSRSSNNELTWSSKRVFRHQPTTMRYGKLTHSGLSWHTSRDNDNISASQSLLETIIRGEVSLDLCGRGDVGQVRSDTRGVDDIEEAELSATTAQSALASSIPLYIYVNKAVCRVYIPRRREGWSSRAEPKAGQYHLQIAPPLISTQIYPHIPTPTRVHLQHRVRQP